MNANQNEQWKPVPGYEDYYEISNLGRVRRIDPEKGTWFGRIITPIMGSGGYLSIRLAVNGVKKNCTLHRLLALVWIPGYEPGLQVNHKDCNKTNNSLDNLEWVTHPENMRHARANLDWDSSHTLGGRKGWSEGHARGERINTAKLTEDQVREIRSLSAAGMSNRKLAEQFGVNNSQISRIVNRKLWTHV